MEWLEANPLPDECKICHEGECYNCDIAGARWHLSELDELRLRKKILEKAIARMQKRIIEIDERIGMLNV